MPMPDHKRFFEGVWDAIDLEECSPAGLLGQHIGKTAGHGIGTGMSIGFLWYLSTALQGKMTIEEVLVIAGLTVLIGFSGGFLVYATVRIVMFNAFAWQVLRWRWVAWTALYSALTIISLWLYY